jgi:hypothetical protein
VPLDEGGAELLDDELNSVSRLVALGDDFSQSLLPLEAAFCRSLQWSP